jgi:hypothetical protein
MLSSFGVSILYPWTTSVIFCCLLNEYRGNAFLSYFMMQIYIYIYISALVYIFFNLSMLREESEGKLKAFWVTLKMMWCQLISLVIAGRLLFLM